MEHPWASMIWKMPEVQGLMKRMFLIKTDMCTKQLQNPDTGMLIKKTTGLLVSHEDMRALGTTCPGPSVKEHAEHCVIQGKTEDGNSLSKSTGQYTTLFIQAVLETIPNYSSVMIVEVDQLCWDEFKNDGSPVFCDVCLVSCTDSDAAEVLVAQTSEPTTQQLDSAIKKLHNNLGHIGQRDLLRILRNGGASEDALVRAKQFECDLCKSHVKPAVANPAHGHRIAEFNERIGIDVKFLPGWLPNQKVKAVNMLDYGSSLQIMVPFFENETAQLLRNIYNTRWRAWAGVPVEVLVDPAKTNLGEAMVDPTEQEGTTVLQTAGEAHWQLGKTEVHGGWFAKILQKIIDQVSPQNKEEWLECVAQAHAKNELIQVYGMSPAQHVFGRNPRIPTDLLQEDPNPVAATCPLYDEQSARRQSIRTAARKAVIDVQDSNALRRALAARPRVERDFVAGDKIAYWRNQKWQLGVLLNKGRWYGTAIVLGRIGRNYVIAHRRQIFRCAPEQLRFATTEEKIVIETPGSELLGIKDLIEGGTFRSAQYVDLTSQDYPSSPEDTLPPDRSTPSPEEPSGAQTAAQQLQQLPVMQQPQSLSIVPTATAPIPVDNDTGDHIKDRTDHQPYSLSSSSNPSAISNLSTSLPETYGPVRRRVPTKNGPDALFRPPAMRQDDFVDIMREVVPQLIEQLAQDNQGTKRASSPEHSSILRSEPRVEQPPVSKAKLSPEQEIMVVEICDAWEEGSDIEVLIANFMQKKQQKEIRASGNYYELQEKIDYAKIEEWKTLFQIRCSRHCR